ncbi:hypothetical protein C8F01DRAFT_1082883 [Mycena amicta]|nr:hypothetical protein C8F01DRAFT_1082883 [Mycena amicta]
MPRLATVCQLNTIAFSPLLGVVGMSKRDADVLLHLSPCRFAFEPCVLNLQILRFEVVVQALLSAKRQLVVMDELLGRDFLRPGAAAWLQQHVFLPLPWVLLGQCGVACLQTPGVGQVSRITLGIGIWSRGMTEMDRPVTLPETIHLAQT